MRLREIRTKKRFMQKEVADAVGVTAAAVHHWETGTCEPSLTNLKKTAEFLGCTVNDLLEDPEADDVKSEDAAVAE
jgi:transcriptional regulator with XRE-family HTH domain